MFTGLVLGTGEITKLIHMGREARLHIRPHFTTSPWEQGESIAVNGACLSVETFSANSFSAYASEETLAKTNLRFLQTGNIVNLERALALGDRLGGHLVSGHIDALAQLVSISPKGASRCIRVSFPASFARQVIPKGSVALDGISLTINECGTDFLEVNVIPETLSSTTIGSWTQGREVNFETDLIGKYVERMLMPHLALPETQSRSELTLDFLRTHGF